MAAKPKTQYQCQECGATSTKWAGQCAGCGAWNTLVEVAIERSGGAASRSIAGPASSQRVVSVADLALDEEPRMSSGMSEIDRVLGGGLVPGSVILIGGDPGIGKSTLLLQLVARVSADQDVRNLYVSGEESARQIGLRAQRLSLPRAGIRLLTENHLESILAHARNERPEVLVIDSIQTVYSDALGSAPGSVSQVRECAADLVRYAKSSSVALFLVGHVTKEGAIAGPRVLEHMVDTVLYFEGDTGGRYRMIRAVKNRFGAVNELGLFAMTDGGLREVANPSAIFLARHENPIPGSIVTVTREGTRPLLLEVQALVDGSQLSNPRRITVGIEHNRLAMLLAVLHRHAGIVTYDQDVFLNVVGGVRITETSADLAIALAVVSSLKDRPLPGDLLAFGEIGLAGELRPAANGVERLREAAKHGFTRAVVPAANRSRHNPGEIEVIAVETLAEALDAVNSP